MWPGCRARKDRKMPGQDGRGRKRPKEAGKDVESRRSGWRRMKEAAGEGWRKWEKTGEDGGGHRKAKATG